LCIVICKCNHCNFHRSLISFRPIDTRAFHLRKSELKFIFDKKTKLCNFWNWDAFVIEFINKMLIKGGIYIEFYSVIPSCDSFNVIINIFSRFNTLNIVEISYGKEENEDSYTTDEQTMDHPWLCLTLRNLTRHSNEKVCTISTLSILVKHSTITFTWI
jgi:hypothetical protein